MHSTPATLLERLRKPGESSAWHQFVDLFTPLLYHWAKSLRLQESDRADLVQEAFLQLFRKLPEFEYDKKRSFHAWLWTLFQNLHRVSLRGKRPHLLDGPLPDSPEFPDDPLEEQEYRQYLIQRCQNLIERDFPPKHWEAFRQYVLAELPIEQVAKNLGLRPGTIYGIKSKVLSRMQQSLQHLMS